MIVDGDDWRIEIGVLGRSEVKVSDEEEEEEEEEELQHQRSSRERRGKCGRHVDACCYDDVLRQISRYHGDRGSLPRPLVAVPVTLTLTAVGTVLSTKSEISFERFDQIEYNALYAAVFHKTRGFMCTVDHFKPCHQSQTPQAPTLHLPTRGVPSRGTKTERF